MGILMSSVSTPKSNENTLSHFYGVMLVVCLHAFCADHDLKWFLASHDFLGFPSIFKRTEDKKYTAGGDKVLLLSWKKSFLAFISPKTAHKYSHTNSYNIAVTAKNLTAAAWSVYDVSITATCSELKQPILFCDLISFWSMVSSVVPGFCANPKGGNV